MVACNETKLIMTFSKNAKGFTLIELIVIMVIVGILSSISLINLSQPLKQQTLLTAARETHSWLNLQRSLAMKEGGQACVISIDAANATLDPSAENVVLSSGETLPNSCSSQTPFSIRDSVKNGSEINLSVAPNSASTIKISFRGLTEVSTNNVNVNSLVLALNLAGSNKQRCIKILNPLGLIRTGWASANSTSCNYSHSF